MKAALYGSCGKTSNRDGGKCLRLVNITTINPAFIGMANDELTDAQSIYVPKLHASQNIRDN